MEFRLLRSAMEVSRSSKTRKEYSILTYDELSDLFQRSFPGGSADTDENHQLGYCYGGNVWGFKNLKLNRKSPIIGEAIVIFNQEGRTLILDKADTSVKLSITPMTNDEYNTFKAAGQENQNARSKR